MCEKLLLSNGLCVSEDGEQQKDLLIENGIITRMGTITESDRQTAKIIDCKDKIILPGFIDAHTHFDLDVAGTTTIDDYESGTLAALMGGTTTVIDFAHQYHGESPVEGIRAWHEKAGKGKLNCNYGLHLAITEVTEHLEEELRSITENGITSFKLYMTYDVMVEDKDIHRILRALKPYGAIVGMHCENDGIIAALRLEEEKSGINHVSCHYKTRPDIAEAEAVNRFIKIAQTIDIPVMIVHLTNKMALDVIRNARADNLKVLAETCPQYLLLSQDKYDKGGIEAAKYVISPPLRTRSDHAALWEALGKNEIQTVATDHCSFNIEQKSIGLNDYRKIPGGMPGVETRGLLIYEYGVYEKRLSLGQFAKLLSTNPAKIYGMYPKKGCLKVGSDADITVLNPNKTTKITASSQISKCDYSPFEGVTVNCSIDEVILNGRHAVSGSKHLIEGGGLYVKRGKPDLNYENF